MDFHIKAHKQGLIKHSSLLCRDQESRLALAILRRKRSEESQSMTPIMKGFCTLKPFDMLSRECVGQAARTLMVV